MKKFKVKVRVRLKEGILDPQSEAILRALHSLEFKSVESVSLEKSFDLEISSETEGQALELARTAAQRLLANLVMEDFDVECVQ